MSIVLRSTLAYSIIRMIEKISIWVLLILLIIVLASATIEPLYSIVSVIFRFNPFKSSMYEIIKTALIILLLTVAIVILCSDTVLLWILSIGYNLLKLCRE